MLSTKTTTALASTVIDALKRAQLAHKDSIGTENSYMAWTKRHKPAEIRVHTCSSFWEFAKVINAETPSGTMIIGRPFCEAWLLRAGWPDAGGGLACGGRGCLLEA